ncbi:MAG: hypothetical protein ACK49F_04945 [Bacteroidota bacterium]
MPSTGQPSHLVRKSNLVRRPTSHRVIDPPSSSTRHPPATPSPLYFTEVNRLWKNYNVAAYLCAI